MSKKRLTYICICGRMYRADMFKRKKSVAAVQKLLRDAADEGQRGTCYCNGEVGIPMEIKAGNVRCPHLANFEGGGAKHADHCDYRSVTPVSAVEIPQRAVKFVGGAVDVIADFSLMARVGGAASPKGHEAVEGSEAEHEVRERAGLVGVSNGILHSRGFDEWSTAIGRVTYKDWYRRMVINSHADRLNGKSLGRSLFIPPLEGAIQPSLFATSFVDFIGQLAEEPPVDFERRGLVIGQVKLVSPGDKACNIRLVGENGLLMCSASKWRAIQKKYPRCAARLNDGQATGTHVLIIALVRLSRKGDLEVVDAGLSLTSRDYVPVDSLHEAKTANQLVHERRHFNKPMLRQRDGEVLADFKLLDVAERFSYLEVWGRDDPEYLQRKAAKIAWYLAHGLVLWQWEAVNGGPRPPFPPAEE